MTLSVLIESVSGLKSGALALSKRHQCLDYYSAVGVNLYTKQYISFLRGCGGSGGDTLRVSDTEARVLYIEEYNYRTQYLLPLLVDNTTSLAECMQTGSLLVEIWHQSVRGESSAYQLHRLLCQVVLTYTGRLSRVIHAATAEALLCLGLEISCS